MNECSKPPDRTVVPHGIATTNDYGCVVAGDGLRLIHSGLPPLGPSERDAALQSRSGLL